MKKQKESGFLFAAKIGWCPDNKESKNNTTPPPPPRTHTHTHTHTHAHTRSASVVVSALGSQTEGARVRSPGRTEIIWVCLLSRVAPVHLAVSRYGM